MRKKLTIGRVKTEHTVFSCPDKACICILLLMSQTWKIIKISNTELYDQISRNLSGSNINYRAKVRTLDDILLRDNIPDRLNHGPR